MSEESLRYPVPWDIVLKLAPYLRRGTPCPFDLISAEVAARILPAPLITGSENLPADPRFVLAANHYQRKGLWIAHAACVVTQIIARRYGPSNTPVHWIVTANWPSIGIGRLRISSPGDALLPRVAAALGCYPVSTNGSNRGFTAATLRRLLREAPRLTRPIGIFPEGVLGRAGERPNDAHPGVDRLLSRLANTGMPLIPVGISESAGRFVIRIGSPAQPAQVMENIRNLVSGAAAHQAHR